MLLRACASTLGHTLCSTVLTTQSHQILCAKYSAPHASRPSRPRLSPLRSLKSQARKKSARFAGEYDAGGFAAAGQRGERRGCFEYPLPRPTVVGRSPEKTALRVACLKHQR